MNRDTCAINFTGLTHDHTSVHSNVRPAEGEEPGQCRPADLCSAISILKRHPMYDCLILVKKFRNCLAGYSLEFPVDWVRDNEQIPTNESAKHVQRQQATDDADADDHNHHASGRSDAAAAAASETQQVGLLDRLNTSVCSRRRLVSRFLDGDDPMYQTEAGEPAAASAEVAQENLNASQTQSLEVRGSKLPFMVQIDDKGERCDLVHVPVNGLLDRLENYTRSGIAVDSRVYAFAMGLKTAERMMTTKSMKELQETPI